VLEELISDDAAREHWLAKFVAFPDLDLGIERVVVVGEDEVWARGVFRATHAGDWPPYPATGRFVEMGYMGRWVVRDGRLVVTEGYWDGAQLLSVRWPEQRRNTTAVACASVFSPGSRREHRVPGLLLPRCSAISVVA
jgi:hypothetical protein